MKTSLVLFALSVACAAAQAAPTPSFLVPLGQTYGGVATQSSTGYGGLAAFANDRNTDGSYWNGSVTHTADGDNSPWWQISLPLDFNIALVEIFNRTDGHAERLSDFTVSLWNDGQLVAQQQVGSLSTNSMALDFLGARGDTVRVSKNTTYLSLAEVFLFEARPQEGGAVPEPASLLLAALGIGALPLALRRRTVKARLAD
jgi:F5/8 type C domain/PEP-CTERM motif